MTEKTRIVTAKRGGADDLFGAYGSDGNLMATIEKLNGYLDLIPEEGRAEAQIHITDGDDEPIWGFRFEITYSRPESEAEKVLRERQQAVRLASEKREADQAERNQLAILLAKYGPPKADNITVARDGDKVVAIGVQYTDGSVGRYRVVEDNSGLIGGGK